MLHRAEKSTTTSRRSGGIAARLGLAVVLTTLGLVAPAVPALAAGTTSAQDVIDAFHDPSSVGGVLTLDQPVKVTESLALASGETLTIDLAGNALTVIGTDGEGGQAGTDPGTKGGAGSDGGAGIDNDGTLVVTGGTLTVRGGNGGLGGDGAPGIKGPSGTAGDPDGLGGPAGGVGGNAGSGGVGVDNHAGASLVLSDVTTTVKGGGGAPGGTGGRGGQGGSGFDAVTSGGTGGDGGVGGPGGDGGNGGDAGISLLNDGALVTVGGGLAEDAGARGPGGPGGDGGSGGPAGNGDGSGANGGPGLVGTDGANGAFGGSADTFSGNANSVTLDGNGSGSPATVTAYAATVGDAIGALATLPASASWPARSGYTLSGWNTAADGSGTALDASSSTSVSDGQTVYAQWTAAPTCDKTTFQQAFDGAADGDTVTLDCDVTITAADNLPLEVASDASITLDLKGHKLTVTATDLKAGIGVPAGTSLTIADTSAGATGKIIAQGGDYAAGIGSNDSTSAGSVTIKAGTVEATGGASAAGIGGGQNAAGTVTISGGHVTATGGGAGAGIGGGYGEPGSSITISDGTVIATGGATAAGIGGGAFSSGVDTVKISGGHVTATGGIYGAGIGGGQEADGGPVTISGGHVSATGGLLGAGIGGGRNGDGGSAVISGTATVEAIGAASDTGTGGGAGIGGGGGFGNDVVGGNGGTVHVASGVTVTATGGVQMGAFGGGAGIGGGGGSGAGNGGGGAAVTIDAGATVTVSSADGSATAIGGGHAGSGTGSGGTTGTFGSLSNAGTLTIKAGSSLVVPSGAIVHNSGTIDNAGTIDGDGTLDGTGTIDNSGAITRTVTVGGQTVKDHHYSLTFDANAEEQGTITWPSGTPIGTVDGPTLASVGYTADDLPTGDWTGHTLAGWNTEADGTGTPVTDTTTLPGSSSDGKAVAITLYAQWDTNVVTLHAYPSGGATSPTSCPVVTDLADGCTLGQALGLAGDGDTVTLEADPGTGTATFTTTTGWDVTQDFLTIKPADGVHPTLDGQHQAISVLHYTGAGTLTVTGLTVANSAGSTDTSTPGGGIVNGAGTLKVAGSTFTGNNVDNLNGYGGGIMNWTSGTAVVTSSTFTDNDVAAGGYAIGGGLVNISQGTTRVESSTFADNTVDGGTGGGITAGDGPVTVIGSTIVRNTADSGYAHGVSGTDVTLAATLLAGNGPDCDAPITDAGHNISSDDSCGFTASKHSVSGSAGLAVTLNRLANNGGPTETMMPFDVSAAVGMIPTGTSVTVGDDEVQLCATTDQRGTPSSGDCNAGSVQGSVTADCSTTAGFAAIFDGATDGDTVALCSDITITAAENLPLILASGESVTLDLNGHTLDVTAPADHAGIGVPASTTLTVTDSNQPAGGTLNATGGGTGSGIGVDHAYQNPGAVTISSGTVVASSSNRFGVGIGGGAEGTDLTIGAAAAVTVSGAGTTAIGSYYGLGTVHNSGLLTLPAGNSIDTTDGTFTNDGTVNNAGTINGSGSIDGTGTVENAGAIAHTVVVGDAQTVKDHHYALHFDAGDGTLDWSGATPWSIVNGPSLGSVGYQAADLPGATRDGYQFTGWQLTSDGSGPAVSDTTVLSTESSDGTPVPVTLHAGWAKAKSLHAYPHGGADSPTSCPVVTDLADACTLAQAIGLANNGDAVILEADPGSGRDATFTTKAGWTVPQSSLTIRPASGVNATLDGQHTAPSVLRFTGVGTLTVTDLTVANSVGGVIMGGSAMSPGGGIVNAAGGTVHAIASTFSGNTTSGREQAAAIGGGIVNINLAGAVGGTIGVGGAIVVEGSTFTGNTSASAIAQSVTVGGGIENIGGTVTVTGATFDGNTATASSGAQEVMGGGIVSGLFDSTSGVGVTLSVTTSTFTGNTVNSDGSATAAGGGILSAVGTGTVVASTFLDNDVVTNGTQSSTTYGGGLVAGGAMAVAASIFAGEGPSCNAPDGSGAITDAGYNIADDSSCGFTASTSVSGSAGLADTLNALSDNGGPTETIAPKPGSPVVGMIPAGASATIGGDSVALCPTTDQRGVTSADGEACNAGSVQSAGPLTITTDSLPGGTAGTDYGTHALAATGGVGAYTWAISQGSLPDGLKLSGDGVITGTPHVAGTVGFTVQVTDNAGFADTQALSITTSLAPDTHVTVNGGDGQSAGVGIQFATALSVTVTDASGSPVASGTDVTFTVTGGSASFDGRQSTEVATGAGGVAAAVLTAGTTAGSVTVTATIAGVSDTATFHEVVTPAMCARAPFRDVPPTDPNCAYINWMVDGGTTSGYPDQTYRPDSPVTRQTLAAFLYRLGHDGNQAPACTSAPFSDVPTTNPFCGAISWLVAEGASNGYLDGTFHPTQAVTKQALAAFLYRLDHGGASAPDCTTSPYSDVPTTSQFCGAISWASGAGILTGTGGNYQPLLVVTRGSIAPVLFSYSVLPTGGS